MNWYKIFYFVSLADSIKSFFDTFSNIFTWFAAISLIILVILVAMRASTLMEGEKVSEEGKAEMNFWVKRFNRFFWFSTTIAMIMWAGYVFTPTKKDAILIVAGGAVGNFIASDSSAKQIPSELTLLIRERLKSDISELKNPLPVDQDTLASKTKEELLELLKSKK